MTMMMTRRQALKAIAAAGAGAAATGLYTWRVEPHWLEFTSPALAVSALPPELESRTIAQISDLHIGPRVDNDYILATFRRVRALAPDFVIFTGDWITYRGPAQLDQLRLVLREAPRGRLGTLGILGNHDYGINWRMQEVGDEVADAARAAGVTMLRNSAVTLSGLQFIGLDDLWGPRFNPGNLVEKKSQDAPTIVLCHNPDGADHPVWGGYRGWILAGHTHGGQCKPPFLPPPLLPVANRRYVSGEYELAGQRRMYISRGVGHLLQVRFNVRPEVPIFSLRRSA